MDYLLPLQVAYKKAAYNLLEHAIFPSYFHGKCLVNNIVPKGCPNPDCPVVCGTPGSLVHFYSTLRKIVFASTRDLLQELVKPDGKVYRQIEAAVMRDVERGFNFKATRMFKVRRGTLGMIHGKKKRGPTVKSELKEILKSIGIQLAVECGSQDGNLDDLPRCSWRNLMEEFILQYP